MNDFCYFCTKTFQVLFLLFITSCDWPYHPQQEPYPGDKTQSTVTGSGIVYTVNTGKQICNPSISQDEVNYQGCILWLGFAGELVVNVPVEMSGYTTDSAKQHDRLTICDTSNTVRWYIMREELSVPGHIQDPEWSTHPDYIACLGEDASGKCDGYAVRISDKSYLKFCEDRMIYTSAPHIWLPDSITTGGTVTAPEYDSLTGFVKKAYITQFFGTSNVKIVYTLENNGLTIYYIDYSDSIPTPIQLLKPENKTIWDCESPLISPEGNWITYNCYADVHTYHAYIQRLKAGSIPVLISEDAADPHWWIDPLEVGNPYYIVYARINGSHVVGVDLADPSIEKSGSAGATYKQKLKGSPGDVPAHMGLKVDVSSPPERITGLPFKGGLSRSGYFLCTGYKYAYIMLLQ